MKRFTNIIKTSIALSIVLPSISIAKEIKTNTAQMQAMDKVTGRVKVIEVPVKGNVNFGTFSILVRDCQTRPPEETPENYAFVDILDNNSDGTTVNVFRGWMLSSTQSLNAVEHPIYDVWLLKCIDTEVDKSTLLSDEELKQRNDIPSSQFATKPATGEPVNLLENLTIEDETIITDITEGNIVANDNITNDEVETIEDASENTEALVNDETKMDNSSSIQTQSGIIVRGLVPDNIEIDSTIKTNALDNENINLKDEKSSNNLMEFIDVEEGE